MSRSTSPRAAKTFIASKIVTMPELPESATHKLRVTDWRGETRWLHHRRHR